MKSKEFEALSKESQQQYFRLYIEFQKLKNKKRSDGHPAKSNHLT